ncbi:MAG: hypothetical protein ACREMY_15120 [bacterium]
MRIHVLYNSSGKILAAVELSEGVSEGTPQVRPVAKPGQHSADLEGPPALAHLGFKDACEKLVVDVTQKVHCLKART